VGIMSKLQILFDDQKKFVLIMHRLSNNKIILSLLRLLMRVNCIKVLSFC
jgi:hypothetical protein